MRPEIPTLDREVAGSNETAWYAVRTRAQYERRVASALAEKGYEEFVPLYPRRYRYRGQTREVDAPLLPGYVFCRFDVYNRLPILVTPGVWGIVGSGKIPISVEYTEIEALQSVVAAGLPARPWPFLKVGQWVRITDGALEDLEGILVSVKKKHRVVVSVGLLERSVAVDIDDAWVAPIPARRESRRLMN